MFYIDGDDNYNSCRGLPSISHRRSLLGSCFYCCCAECAAHQLSASIEFIAVPFEALELLLSAKAVYCWEVHRHICKRSSCRWIGVFYNVKPVAFPPMSCTLVCPSLTAVACLLSYYPCSDTLYSSLRIRSSLTTISLAVLVTRWHGGGDW